MASVRLDLHFIKAVPRKDEWLKKANWTSCYTVGILENVSRERVKT
jgi:hypothetical protein